MALRPSRVLWTRHGPEKGDLTTNTFFGGMIWLVPRGARFLVARNSIWNLREGCEWMGGIRKVEVQ